MKKFTNLSFVLGLAIWFATAFYLSINYLIGIFTEIEPTTSKYILAISFVWTAGIGIYNKIRGGDFTHLELDVNRVKKEKTPKKPGCTTCGKNKIKK